MINCRLCNKSVDRSDTLERHLRNEHKISKIEYRNLFE